jgi:hypothetical protein
MKQKWGREGYVGDWPSDRRVWSIAAFFVDQGGSRAVRDGRKPSAIEETAELVTTLPRVSRAGTSSPEEFAFR